MPPLFKQPVVVIGKGGIDEFAYRPAPWGRLASVLPENAARGGQDAGAAAGGVRVDMLLVGQAVVVHIGVVGRGIEGPIPAIGRVGQGRHLRGVRAVGNVVDPAAGKDARGAGGSGEGAAFGAGQDDRDLRSGHGLVGGLGHAIGVRVAANGDEDSLVVRLAAGAGLEHDVPNIHVVGIADRPLVVEVGYRYVGGIHAVVVGVCARRGRGDNRVGDVAIGLRVVLAVHGDRLRQIPMGRGEGEGETCRWRTAAGGDQPLGGVAGGDVDGHVARRLRGEDHGERGRLARLRGHQPSGRADSDGGGNEWRSAGAAVIKLGDLAVRQRAVPDRHLVDPAVDGEVAAIGVIAFADQQRVGGVRHRIRV